MKLRFVDVVFIFSSKRHRYFSNGPSSLCSSTRLFRPFFLDFQLVCGDTIAQKVLAHTHSVSLHLKCSLNSPSSPLLFFLCLFQHHRWKNITAASALKLSVQSLDHRRFHFALISGRIQSGSSSSAGATYRKSVSIPNFWNSFPSSNLVKKL